MVVNGAYRGYRAVLKSLDAKHFCVTITIDSVLIFEMSSISYQLLHFLVFLLITGARQRTNCGRRSI